MSIETRATDAPVRARRPGTVIVTGGASGLGAATADAIARAGGTPVVVDRSVPSCTHAWVRADLSDTAAAQEVVADVARRYAGLDAVVTCAGVDRPGPFVELPADEWEWIVRVNLFGTAAIVRAALPLLVERRGRAVLVASTLGHRAVADASAYCASKFAVVGLARALTAELKGLVGVTLLTPGGMRTSFFDEREPRYKPGPDARLCRPADVADAVVYALGRPEGCEVKEIVIASPEETSWP